MSSIDYFFRQDQISNTRIRECSFNTEAVKILEVIDNYLKTDKAHKSKDNYIYIYACSYVSVIVNNKRISTVYDDPLCTPFIMHELHQEIIYNWEKKFNQSIQSYPIIMYKPILTKSNVYTVNKLAIDIFMLNAEKNFTMEVGIVYKYSFNNKNNIFIVKNCDSCSTYKRLKEIVYFNAVNQYDGKYRKSFWDRVILAEKVKILSDHCLMLDKLYKNFIFISNKIKSNIIKSLKSKQVKPNLIDDEDDELIEIFSKYLK